MCSSIEPGITEPTTSKVSLSEDVRLAAQPLKWLSPIIEILFYRGLGKQVFLILTGSDFPNVTGRWEAVESTLTLPLVEILRLTITEIQ
jgi:hypothetical protein